VLAALIKHSGCVAVCLAEDECLSSGTKVLTERPCSLLTDVWRSAQLCMEHAVRSKKGSTLDSVGVMLGRKAELLLDILPNEVCNAVQDALAVAAAEMSQQSHQQTLLCPQLMPNTKLEVPFEVQKDCSKQLSEASEFLRSPLRDIAHLKALLMRASFHAITRTAGLKAYMLLFNKIEGDMPKAIGKLPPLSTIAMQPAAVEFLFLAFRGDYHCVIIFICKSHGD
jgi:hypothetical protein